MEIPAFSRIILKQSQFILVVNHRIFLINQYVGNLMAFEFFSVDWSEDNNGLQTYFASHYKNVVIQSNNKGSLPGELMHN